MKKRPDAGSEIDERIRRIREEIDKVDAALLELLNQRAAWTIEIGKIKEQLGLAVYDPQREQEIFMRLETINGGPLPQEAVKRLFERIIDESRHMEKEIILKDEKHSEKPE